jgi:hypothetical protein
MTTCACTNCQFMLNQSGQTGKHKGESLGQCRYNPPLANSDGNMHGQWPLVASQDWCGHFAAKVERFMTAAE